jgi:hypothetical protein
MWEDEGVDAFYSLCCKDTIYWNATCTESGMNRPTGVPSTHFCEVEIVFGQPPCYSSSLDIFVEVAKEDYVVVDFLPLYELGDQLLQKNGSRRTFVTKGGEVSCVGVLDGGSCGSTRVAGLIGHYNSCLFGSRSDSYPAPSAEVGVVGSQFHNFRGNCVQCHDCTSAILVDPHPLVYVVHHDAPRLHPSTN